ncbi:MAG: flagellar hook-basal body complex protein FliE [Erythrobacter sp.]
MIGSSNSVAGLQDIMALRSQVLSRSQALQNVRAAADAPQATDASAANAKNGPAFADTLVTALEGVSNVQKHSAMMQEGYERGEVTDIAQVMIARQEAGVAFEATLQVRNKLLTAYQDIMRMGS